MGTGLEYGSQTPADSVRRVANDIRARLPPWAPRGRMSQAKPAHSSRHHPMQTPQREKARGKRWPTLLRRTSLVIILLVVGGYAAFKVWQWASVSRDAPLVGVSVDTAWHARAGITTTSYAVAPRRRTPRSPAVPDSASPPGRANCGRRSKPRVPSGQSPLESVSSECWSPAFRRSRVGGPSSPTG